MVSDLSTAQLQDPASPGIAAVPLQRYSVLSQQLQTGVLSRCLSAGQDILNRALLLLHVSLMMLLLQPAWLRPWLQ